MKLEKLKPLTGVTKLMMVCGGGASLFLAKYVSPPISLLFVIIGFCVIGTALFSPTEKAK